jgi:hypothetical protein
MSLLKCPRCGVMVEVSASASPQCATCNFSGPDTRPAPGAPATPPPAPPTHAGSGIVVALGLWRGRSWAWTLQLILLALQALSAGSGLTHGSALALPGLALIGLLGWYFFTPGVKAYFGWIEVAA